MDELNFDINTLKISDIGEKKLVSFITEKIGFENFSNEFNGFKEIWDDAAVLDLGDFYLTFTSDILIEKYHFPSWLTYCSYGFKAVSVNMSDLAAMGSKPVGIIISLSLPGNLSIDSFDQLLDGIVHACNYYNVPLIGGDTNEGNEIIISPTVIGKNKKNEILYKYGFKKGDLLAITGPIGFSALAFQFYETKKTDLTNALITEFAFDESKIFEDILKKIELPFGKIEEGQFLSKFSSVSAATDISDGLASELGEMINENRKFNQTIEVNKNVFNKSKSNKNEFNKNKSNKNSFDPNYLKNGLITIGDYDDIYNFHPKNFGFRVYENRIPFIKEIKRLSKILNKNYLNVLFNFGEDFELVFTVDKNNIDEFKKKYESKFPPCYVIGEVTDSDLIELELMDGSTKILNPKGYEHFKD
ncbi:thiamine-phosphate kinase [Methanobrevibacter curvatus]|uniref:Thiamine-monophosphate kinase n=1 Tax=Methanobrevibacter curvatus TaxID=49547 RepID=A0A165ZR62_9EURY|nr:thiamine-phosphate kinase [Methanobrevibacter curvatus]KZX11059.1 thiamine-monophosphate kinase [Methanobrevibacter curvatus]